MPWSEDGGMKVRFVGSGDAFGSGGRWQTCIHVSGEGQALLVDCGATSLVAMKAQGLDPNAVGGPQAARASIEELRAGGFLGVKLHPRLNGVDVGGRPMRWVLEACMELSFPILLCTNFTGFSEQDLSSGVTLLRHYLGEFSQLPMVLLHGGFTKMEAVAAKAAASLGVRFPPSS